MSYKEFVLLYTTLILGLACANVFYGLGEIMIQWRKIKISWHCFIPYTIMLMTVVDFWFHAFLFPYEIAKGSIMHFLAFLLPPVILFFNTLIISPTHGSECTDYDEFLQQSLRNSVLTYALMILATLTQFYLTDFMLNLLALPIILALLVCALVYWTNSVAIYRIAVPVCCLLNILRWIFE